MSETPSSERPSNVELAKETTNRDRVIQALSASLPEGLELGAEEMSLLFNKLDLIFSEQPDHYRRPKFDPTILKKNLSRNPQIAWRLNQAFAEGHKMDVIRITNDGSFVFMGCEPTTESHDMIKPSDAQELVEPTLGCAMPTLYEYLLMQLIGDFDQRLYQDNRTASKTILLLPDKDGSQKPTFTAGFVQDRKIIIESISDNAQLGVGYRPMIVVPPAPLRSEETK